MVVAVVRRDRALKKCRGAVGQITMTRRIDELTWDSASTQGAWLPSSGSMKLFDGYLGPCSDVMLHSEDFIHLVWLPDA